MIKFENDLEDLPSVDPHLIQPLAEQQQPTFDDLLIDRNLETSCASIPEDAQPVGNAIRMEHCINLDLYLTPIRDTMAHYYTDELNTPDTFVSEAAKELNKITNTTTHQKQSDGNPFNFPAAIKYQMNDEMATASEPKSNVMNSNNFAAISNIFNFQNSHSDVLVNVGTPNVQHERFSMLSPSSNFDLEGIDLEEYDFLNDYNDAILHDMNNVNNNDENNIIALELSQPHNTVTTINEHHNYALKLKIEGTQVFPDFASDNLQTPDIINSILQYDTNTNQEFKFTAEYIDSEQIKEEWANFNIKSEVPLVKSEAAEVKSETPQEVTSLSPKSDVEISFLLEPELEQPETPETPLTHDDSSLQSFASSTKQTSRGRRRKYTDDDEEYFPPKPSKHRRTTKRQSIRRESSDEDEYIPAKIPKRGRPSKPVSRASDSSECSKYREMRDKNNEASRRSRRKRRMHEQTIEEECEELNTTNERLRAQVGELEKSVSTYRENLMALLLRQK